MATIARRCRLRKGVIPGSGIAAFQAVWKYGRMCSTLNLQVEMLDREGYRPNVGIILCNAKNEVFWGKRIREHSWQFPQGGIKRGRNA
jgi:hypothetical protein